MAIFYSYMTLEPSTNETYSACLLFALSLFTDLEEPILLSLLLVVPSLNNCLF